MDLIFSNPGFYYSLDSIIHSCDKGWNKAWSDSFFQVYSHLERKKFFSLPVSQRREYLEKALLPYYLKREPDIAWKIGKYNNHWQKHKKQITEAFSEAFQRDYTNRLNSITGNVTINPADLRNLNARSFDVFYLVNENGALGVALHEMTHFVWFDVWQTHFLDNCTEYEPPHIKWIFSEMAVDSIMRKDIRLNWSNPYFPVAHVNEYFYTMKLEGKPVLETIYEKYKNVGIIEFMEWGLAYCIKYEDEIRTQIK